MYSILSILVENKPGILFKVTHLFRSRNFNIESISVGVTTDHDFSRMTIVTIGNEKQIQQIVKQINKMIDTIDVKILNQNKSVYKETVLFKVLKNSKLNITKLNELLEPYNGKMYKGDISVIIELTETPDKIIAFEEQIKSYNILETARTGIVALENNEH
ncbi:MAG: acetolactate synthase small subunit [Thaumarchaeota archaeon]|nr:acetolactate synthase small subunit [Nitrososphaerota archaeon]MCY3976068.1 acetolactate synthase small subunit [Nitrososphaerota archaeon]